MIMSSVLWSGCTSWCTTLSLYPSEMMDPIRSKHQQYVNICHLWCWTQWDASWRPHYQYLCWERPQNTIQPATVPRCEIMNLNWLLRWTFASSRTFWWNISSTTVIVVTLLKSRSLELNRNLVLLLLRFMLLPFIE